MGIATMMAAVGLHSFHSMHGPPVGAADMYLSHAAMSRVECQVDQSQQPRTNKPHARCHVEELRVESNAATWKI